MALTKLQKIVIQELREHDCWFLASATEEKWSNGKTHYIDDRVQLSKELKEKFKKANNQVKANLK